MKIWLESKCLGIFTIPRLKKRSVLRRTCRIIFPARFWSARRYQYAITTIIADGMIIIISLQIRLPPSETRRALGGAFHKVFQPAIVVFSASTENLITNELKMFFFPTDRIHCLRRPCTYNMGRHTHTQRGIYLPTYILLLCSMFSLKCQGTSINDFF